MNRVSLRSSILLAVAAVAGVARAEDSQFYAYVSNVSLLQDASVRKELGVTEKQRAIMNQHADWHSRQLAALEEKVKAEAKKTGARPEFPVKELSILMEELKRRVLTEMSQPQIKRLGEISLQSLGPQALVDPRVAARISVTDAQRKKLEASFKENGRKIAEATDKVVKPIQDKYKDKKADEATKKEFEKEISAAREKVKPVIEGFLEAIDKTIDTTLTDSQKKAWRELLGRPFQPPKS